MRKSAWCRSVWRIDAWVLLAAKALVSSECCERPRSRILESASSTSLNNGMISGSTHGMHSGPVSRLIAGGNGSRAIRKSRTSRIRK